MLLSTVGEEATTRAISKEWTWYWTSRRCRLNEEYSPKATISVSVTTTSCNTNTCVASRKSMRPRMAISGPYEQNAQKSNRPAGFTSQVVQEALCELLRMLSMHEVPAGDLLDDVLVLEHPRRAPVVRGFDVRI